VADASGHLIAFTRMDGAALQATQIAQDKAYTAAGFGMPTAHWHEFLQQDAPLAMGAPTSRSRGPERTASPVDVPGGPP
jgi:uncharacterized protein GlcG (DUF336 family)